MANNVFAFVDGAQLRVLPGPVFVASDVCATLDVGNVSSALSRLDDDEKGIAITDTPGGRQPMAVVTEAGLYRLVLTSRKPIAREYSRWITHEVLPAIRRDGGYVEDATQFAMALAQDTDEAATLTARIHKLQSDLNYTETIRNAAGTITMADMAHLLKQQGYDIGRTRLMLLLREEGLLMKQGDSWNMPTQAAMELGLFEIKENAATIPHLGYFVRKTTVVTGKGQYYIAALLQRKKDTGPQINSYLGKNEG